MKLKKFDFYLDWPVSIKINNLRQFIIENLMKKGIVIRWSIVDVKTSNDDSKIRKIRIHAILANSINP